MTTPELFFLPRQQRRASYLNRRTALYRHFDKDGRLLYVGVTFNPGQRASGHRAYAEWIDQAVSFTGTWFNTRAEALAAEKEAIRTENPLYNKDRFGGPASTAAFATPDPDSDRPLNCRMDYDLVERMDATASEFNTNRSEVIRAMLDFSLQHMPRGWRP